MVKSFVHYFFRISFFSAIILEMELSDEGISKNVKALEKV